MFTCLTHLTLAIDLSSVSSLTLLLHAHTESSYPGKLGVIREHVSLPLVTVKLFTHSSISDYPFILINNLKGQNIFSVLLT